MGSHVCAATDIDHKSTRSLTTVGRDGLDGIGNRSRAGNLGACGAARLAIDVGFAVGVSATLAHRGAPAAGISTRVVGAIYSHGMTA